MTPWLDEQLPVHGRVRRRYGYALAALLDALTGRSDFYSLSRTCELTLTPEERLRLLGALLPAVDDDEDLDDLLDDFDEYRATLIFEPDQDLPPL